MVQTDLQSNQGMLFIAAYSGGEFKNIGGLSVLIIAFVTVSTDCIRTVRLV